MYCTQCGTANPEGAIFCQNCGVRLENAPRQTGSYAYGQDFGSYNAASGLTADEAAFIGQNQEYYAQKFDKMRRSNSPVSWNWCGFFFFAYWAIYRKMYKESILYVLVINLLTLLMGGAPILGAWILTGLFSNWLYMRSVEKHMANCANLPEEEKRFYFFRNGGVSMKNVWILLLAVMALSAVITFLTL